MSHKVRCSVCKRVYAGRIPKYGDGSVSFPYWHKALYSSTRRCPGSYRAAEEVPEQATPQETSNGKQTDV